LTASRSDVDGGLVELRSPGVGRYREAPSEGDTVEPGAIIGRLETLGRFRVVRAPKGVRGRVVAVSDPELARAPVGHGDLLIRIDPAAAGEAVASADEGAADPDGGRVFRAPSSGRFYARPSPDKPPFVRAGETVTRGQVVAILEVMKTFNRVSFGGDDLPESAVVERVVPEDGDDLGRGDPILVLRAD
jgi:acetyl-CoA carboxylase biotin carboxyl carrier protein